MSFIDYVLSVTNFKTKTIVVFNFDAFFCKYCFCVLAFEQLSVSTMSFIDTVATVTAFRIKTIATRW